MYVVSGNVHVIASVFKSVTIPPLPCMSCNSIASWYIRIYMHVCMHKNVYTYVYIRIYTHIHIRPEQKSLVAHQLGMARRGALSGGGSAE